MACKRKLPYIYRFLRMPDPISEPICRTLFTDGVWRPVYESPGDRQYVIDDDGQRLYGVWYVPPDADPPLIVEQEARP
jgi:hypothetical protein